MAKSKFDFSLLKPIDEKNSEFEANLRPIEDDNSDYLDKMPPPEGFFHKLPRNILAGLANLGHSTMNIPYNVAKSIENAASQYRDSLSPSLEGLIPGIQEKNQKRHLSEWIPHQQDYNFAQMLGQKGEGTLMDNIIQKAVQYSPEIIGGYGLLKSGLQKFPFTQRMASKKLRGLEKQISDLGIDNIPLSNEVINESLPFLPKTHATREMIKGATAGEYKPSFALQSQIGQHERALRKSPLAAERLLAPQARELKQLILSDMEKGLRMQGHSEAADLLKNGIDDYRKYIKIRDEVFPVLKKIGFPASAFALLGYGYKKGKKLLSEK